MLVIRLQRRGKKKQAFFRVVLQEKTWQPKGKAIEILGFYNPHTKEKNFQGERINYWVSRGAQMTPTLHNLLVDAKIIDGPKKKAFAAKVKKKQREDTKSDKSVEVPKEAPTPPEEGRSPDSSEPSDDVGKEAVKVEDMKKEDEGSELEAEKAEEPEKIEA